MELEHICIADQLFLAAFLLCLIFWDPKAELSSFVQFLPILLGIKNTCWGLFRCLNLLGIELGMPKLNLKTRQQKYPSWVFVGYIYCKFFNVWCIVLATVRSFVQSAAAALHWDPLWNPLHDLEACNLTSLQYLHDYCHANCLLIASLQIFFLLCWKLEGQVGMLSSWSEHRFVLVGPDRMSCFRVETVVVVCSHGQPWCVRQMLHDNMR